MIKTIKNKHITFSLWISLELNSLTLETEVLKATSKSSRVLNIHQTTSQRKV